MIIYQLNNPNTMEAITALLIFLGMWAVLCGFFGVCTWLWRKIGK